MPLYFRADTRSPEEVFKKGFTPQALNQEGFVVSSSFTYDDAIKNWSLYSAINPKKHEKLGSSSDAYSPGCVCMSTNIKSAAMFPVDSLQKTYIYFISMPEAQHINLEDFKNETYESLNNRMVFEGLEFEEIDEYKYGSKASAGLVYDLNNLQLQQVMDLIKNGNINNMQQFLQIAWTLYGYEVVTSEVRPENIIMAVECTNRKRLYSENQELLNIDFQTEFQLGEVLYNLEFNFNRLDWDNAKKLIKHLMAEQFKQKKLVSPSVGWGAGGKILPCYENNMNEKNTAPQSKSRKKN